MIYKATAETGQADVMLVLLLLLIVAVVVAIALLYSALEPLLRALGGA